ncbi:hypothetical protein HY933_04230 [Candidatus Falkowbacteria bacterium]|nr:hypothetical protein [Candidatus Falkowbacteria bacterium]
METKSCYQLQGSAYNNYSIFCSQNWKNSNNVYCDLCVGGGDCFGCVGLINYKYCILNKQYDKEEYERVVVKIIRHMQQTGEWGEFFPSILTPFAYNESVAYEYFPLTKEAVLAKGWRWRDEERKNYQPQIYVVPDKIGEVKDDILNSVLACIHCGKNYKIIPQELEYYRQYDICIPQQCPDCRHLSRMALRNPRKLFERQCDQCGRDLKTTYAPDRPETVYCEECYQKEIY